VKTRQNCHGFAHPAIKLQGLTEAPLSSGAQGRYGNCAEAAIALLSLENGAVAQKI